MHVSAYRWRYSVCIVCPGKFHDEEEAGGGSKQQIVCWDSDCGPISTCCRRPGIKYTTGLAARSLRYLTMQWVTAGHIVLGSSEEKPAGSKEEEAGKGCSLLSRRDELRAAAGRWLGQARSGTGSVCLRPALCQTPHS